MGLLTTHRSAQFNFMVAPYVLSFDSQMNHCNTVGEFVFRHC